MAWVPAAMAVMSAAMSAYSMMQQGDAQEEAARRQRDMVAENRVISEKNAQLEEAENAERERRQFKANEQKEAHARAAAFASGFDIDEEEPGSILLSLVGQQVENKRQEKFEKMAGKSRASIIRRGGNVAASAGLAQAAGMEAEAEASYWGAFAQGAKAVGTARDWWSQA